ncbi:MAG TPA: DUF1684 domain-containing protein [Acidimicrobiia bacterium]|nr:DUF1684 domain-containing protein [Acidimicrobiia bacterium]
MSTQELLDFRRGKDEFFRTNHHSPLGHGDRSGFTGLDYFEPNPDLVFTVPIEEGDGSEVRFPTTDDAEKVYTNAGTVKVEVDGEEVELTLYETGHPGFFLPFRDSTSGKTTYGAGRYLDLEPNDDGTVTIDFNYAYNPSCVYGDGFSCPLPPVNNWLQVPIEAGEKSYPPES